MATKAWEAVSGLRKKGAIPFSLHFLSGHLLVSDYIRNVCPAVSQDNRAYILHSTLDPVLIECKAMTIMGV